MTNPWKLLSNQLNNQTIVSHEVHHCPVLWQKGRDIHSVSLIQVGSRIIHIPGSYKLLIVIGLQHILCEECNL